MMAGNHCVDGNNIPDCCCDCSELNSDFENDSCYCSPFYYCGLNLFMPTKKQTCKKKPIKKENDA